VEVIDFTLAGSYQVIYTHTHAHTYTLTHRCVLNYSVRCMSSCRLRPIDVEFMKAMQDKVNVVPLIAKADCLTPLEIKKLKERVRSEYFDLNKREGNSCSASLLTELFSFIVQ